MCPDTTICVRILPTIYGSPQGVRDGGGVSRRILALIGGAIEERILPLGLLALLSLLALLVQKYEF